MLAADRDEEVVDGATASFDLRTVRRLYSQALPSTRSGALFNAFSYPTKISPESIALFLATHTEPGATVLDPFAGSGSTGVAAKLCARPTSEMLAEAARLRLTPRWGPRNAVLYELSTVGALLARTMCAPPDPEAFEQAAKELVRQATEAVGWMYDVVDPHGEPGRLRHIIWSEVLVCPLCGAKATFWDSCVRLNPTEFVDDFVCTGCKRSVRQVDCARDTERVTDPVLRSKRVVRRRVPVRVHGVTGRSKWQREVLPSDHALLGRVAKHRSAAWVPTDEIYWGDLYRRGYHQGIERYHHFYTHRNLSVLAHLWQTISDFSQELQPALRLLVLSYNATHSTLMTRVVAKKGQVDLVLTGAQSGVLYVSSLPVEKNILEGLGRKIKTFKEAFATTHGLPGTVQVVNESSTRLALDTHSVDYVFTDPPFGAYIPYAELNQVNEAWLCSLTDRTEEAIVSPGQGKSVEAYQCLLKQVFSEISRVLKPAGAATVVFHSSKTSVWNAVSDALTDAGLEVLATSVLDKTQMSFKQANSATSSRGDALILARPSVEPPSLDLSADTGLRTLQRLFARAVLQNDAAELAPARLYSRYAGYSLRHNLPLALDTAAVYALADKLKRQPRVAGASLTTADRKRLGQYFSGSRVAMLLAALSRSGRPHSVIDPMAGMGDMLVAALAVGLTPERLVAVEIEQRAYRRCAARLDALHLDGSNRCIQGNAFDPAVVAGLGLETWDLVITNPPYVRYQTGSSKSGALDLPSADEVRRDLMQTLSAAASDSEYASFLLDKAERYSGLADLAVPSWLLCAALVRPGGTLAMVVPDTWLTRDYAKPIHDLLATYFDIEVVVEDADVSWFPDALVRTNLVVARRRKPDAASKPGIRIRLSGETASARSLVGSVFDEDEPELAFASAVEQWRVSGSFPVFPGCRAEPLGQRRTAAAGWQLPSAIHTAVALSDDFVSLAELGWQVGQGLRTGANSFFYVEVLEDDGTTARVRPSSRIGGSRPFTVPSALLRRVVQRQADLPPVRQLDSARLTGAVLVLDGHARASDRGDISTKQWRAFFGDLPKPVAAFVSAAETTNLGSESEPRFAPELSAVRTNVRRFDAARPERAPRLWYHLPPFAARHTADLLVARVNHRHPRVVLNPDRRALVDANFSTLWATASSALDPHALLAALASTWAAAIFESSATAMGGGALKLEATHLRRMALPGGIRDAAPALKRLGNALTRATDESEVVREIDSVVYAALGLDADAAEAVGELARRLLEGRTT